MSVVSYPAVARPPLPPLNFDYPQVLPVSVEIWAHYREVPRRGQSPYIDWAQIPTHLCTDPVTRQIRTSTVFGGDQWFPIHYQPAPPSMGALLREHFPEEWASTLSEPNAKARAQAQSHIYARHAEGLKAEWHARSADVAALVASGGQVA